ncbi:HAD-IIA family hydrolase (plasmid) [Haloarcula sp. NS06]|uniref:HAD-IIA family hydrolase n=1 Tax=Haloarcula sp. NS06 TaxID=3409688 RepID=UPI003DA7A565
MMRSAIVDLDGTVYRGEELLPGADEGISLLRNGDLDVLFVTNKPIERRDRYCEKLNDLGVPCSSDDLITSATVTADYLSQRHPESVSYVVGEDPLRDELRAADLALTDDPADASVVVASMDREFDYTTLSDSLAAIDEETLFIATNPDRTCPVSDGEIPDAAGMIGAIRGVTGHQLDDMMGKPSETIMRTATTRLGVEPDRCLMIGDRLETDIEMGNRAGMTTVLVLTGVTDPSDVEESPVQPDHVIDSLGDIDEVVHG